MTILTLCLLLPFLILPAIAIPHTNASKPLHPKPSLSDPAPSPAPAPASPPAGAAPSHGSTTNGTLDPSQVIALKSLGISAGLDPCSTALHHSIICDHASPFRHILFLQLDYCPDSAIFPLSAWANLTTLRSLAFNDCPAKLIQLPQKLTDSLTSLSLVTSLGRSVGNELAPGLPGTWLSKFRNLVELTVTDVLVNATSLSSVIANLSHLQMLSFQSTNFTGLLPKTWPLNMSLIDISDNELHGAIPSSLSQLKQLQSLDLSLNNLTGIIPREFGNLTSLQSLKLHGNRLIGPIPSSLSKLTSLTILDLSDNHLNGSIPLFLSTLASLRVINLENNHLHGEIPFNDTFLKSLNSFTVSGNSQLCYNSTIVSAKYVSGLQPCDSSGLPTDTSASGPALSPSGAPAPQPHVQPTKRHHGPKKIVLVVAIALACIVGAIIIVVLLSRWCSRK